MGIRINIVMGYGLTDVECEKHEITDPRINTRSPLLDYDREGEASLEKYREFLNGDESHKTRDFAFEASLLNPKHWAGKGRKLVDPFDCVTHDTEGGMRNVLCITPVWMYNEWHRRDDSIDYAFATYVYNTNPENRVWPLNYSPFPYNGLWLNSRTGERVNERILWWIRAMDGDKPGRWRPRKDMRKKWDEGGREAMDILAQEGGFADHDDAVAHCRPYVPEEIRNLVSFGNLFTDSSVVNTLQPMIYQYWS